MTSPPPAERRLLPLVGAYNFRDLGGYPTVDGRCTRWGRLFRSDTLQELTEADLEVLRDIGLATVVDLRAPSEAQREGRGLLATEPVRYINLPVVPDRDNTDPLALGPGPDQMGARYVWYLEAGGDSLVAALELIADDATHPLVFHCAAGKDRTGIVAALVLGALGVARETIVADYEETSARMELIVERFRGNRAYGRAIDEVPAERYRADPANISQFLDELDARLGGAEGWLLSAGLTADALERLRRGLLEDDSS